MVLLLGSLNQGFEVLPEILLFYLLSKELYYKVKEIFKKVFAFHYSKLREVVSRYSFIFKGIFRSGLLFASKKL